MPSPTCVRILLLLNSRKAEALVIYLFIHLLTDWQVCILDWAVIPPSSHYHPSKYLTFIAWLCIPARERLRFQTAH